VETFNPDTQADRSPMIPTKEEAEAAVRTLLLWVGEDPSREGLLETPGRVVRAFREMVGGKLRPDPGDVLGKVFSAPDCDEMVWVRGIRFSSMCEHHLLPFTGRITLAYIPSGKVVGLSKIPRLACALTARPQLQERLTAEIAGVFMERVAPLGVGVVVQAHHHCMGCRGARQPDAEMVTSCLLGNFREASVRAEFLSMVKT